MEREEQLSPIVVKPHTSSSFKACFYDFLFINCNKEILKVIFLSSFMLKNFRVGIIIRVILVGLSTALLVWLLFFDKRYVAPVLVLCLIFYQLYELFNYLENTNRKLIRFLESIKYADFTSFFAADNTFGRSFKQLNLAFNEVLDAFRKTRAEKEESWQYLHTVVQHINVGIFSYDSEGNIHLINNVARRFLNAPQMHSIHELEVINPNMYEIIEQLSIGMSTLYRQSNETYLSISSTELRLREKSYKIISMQNIQSELQQKEIEAWQNLSKVLRHEIMNSVTPIASLVTTLNDILAEELIWEEGGLRLSSNTLEDISEGLITIQSRSKALIKFINTYRNFTNIPIPQFEIVRIQKLFDRVSNLMSAEFAKENIQFRVSLDYKNLEANIDIALIEMVLINLIKNAIEALYIQPEEKRILLRGYQTYDHHTIIDVSDNGQGIIPEALESIFIPFFTTKAEGSGIGLSWSRQIMQLHKGSLMVNSKVGGPTTFSMRF
jgi:nitrogen fixation/metabolism regulation signal transduction histidine kinase